MSNKAIVGLVSTCSIFFSQLALADIVVTNTELVNTVRLSRYVYQYTYRLSVVNNGESQVLGLKCQLYSSDSHTVITDHEVAVGDLASAVEVTSDDTYTIEQDRRFTLDPTALEWRFDYTEVVTDLSQAIWDESDWDEAYWQ
jgi:hypothetical protein